MTDTTQLLLEPQERFEALTHQTRVRAGTSLLDLAHANHRPDGAVLDAIRDSLSDDHNLSLQYTPFGGETIPRRLVAGQLSRLCRRRFHFRDVVLTPGAMSALTLLFQSLRSPSGNDEVIVVTPCWMDTPLALAQLGLRAVLVPVDPHTLRLDLHAIRDALSPRTRAIVIGQPSSPSGIVHTRDELAALASILHNSILSDPPLLISDESHRDVRFGEAEFVSPVEFYARTCVVYSLGKSLMLEGQRIGYVAVSPDMKHGRAYAAVLARLCRTMGYGTPTVLMQRALPRLLDLRPDLSAIAARRQRVSTRLRALGYELPESQATFFLYPKVPGGDDFAFATELARRGVLVMPSSLFSHAGHVRLSMTAADTTLDAALEVLRDVAPREIPVPELAIAS